MQENAYFVAGVQDEILSDLAKIADLKVISRTSANLYKSGSPRNAREIGQQLGVAHLLEGSVQKTGNRVRLNAQLVDARTDAHLWAQSYDRDVADILAIESELAQTIANQLQARISPNEKALIEARPTDNPEAYRLYLQAAERARVATSKQDAIAADELYAQAIARDPGFALAYAGASMINSLMFYLGREPERKTKARLLLEQALHLAPELGEAHLAYGLYLYRDEDYAAALKEFTAAHAASPNSPEILELSGLIFRRQGKWREALVAFQRTQELDPCMSI
jgi:TolB-like protein